MAVEKVCEKSSLSLLVQVGTLAAGLPKYKAYGYNNIAESASDEAVHTVALELAKLFKPDIAKVVRHDAGTLA